MWYIRQSSSGFVTSMSRQWGVATDRVVPTDYNGDRRADIAVFRPGSGTWFVLDQWARRWGTAGDRPVPMK
jgi:hypothetical protein